MPWTFYTPTVSPSIGTSLPTAPVDGQEFTLVDSLSAPTYSWKLRYVAAKASNKWVFIGGTPMTARIAASESTTSATYAAMTTPGPSLTIPVAGDYDMSPLDADSERVIVVAAVGRSDPNSAT